MNTSSPIYSKPVMHEVQLRKKKLQSEIHQLQKQLKKQQLIQSKSHHQSSSTHLVSSKLPRSRRNLQQKSSISPPNKIDRDSLSGNKSSHIQTHSPRSQISNPKIDKPVISQNWKNLFKKEPYFVDLFQEESKKCQAENKETLWEEPAMPAKCNRVVDYLIREGIKGYCDYF